MDKINLSDFEEIDIDDAVNEIKEELENEFDDFDDFMAYGEDEDDDEEIYSPKASTDVENIDILEKQKAFLKRRERIQSMEDEINLVQKSIFPVKKNYRSIILEYFTPEICIELEKVVRTFSVDNDMKMQIIADILTKYKIPFSKLGGGTNRFGVMIDGYAVKIAYDRDGMIDNKREFIYSLALQPYVVKTYECAETGLVAVFEYVISFTERDILDRENQEAMREILKEISTQFFIGDVGITTKNFGNWGYRRDSGEIVILDFAYIYSVAFKQFQCSCQGAGVLYYDKDFVNLICPVCGKKYTFGQLRKKITRKDQDAEIGDIKEKGYVLHEQNEVLEFNHKFVMDATDTILKKIEKDRKRAEKLAFYRAMKNSKTELVVEDGYHKSVDEIIAENKEE